MRKTASVASSKRLLGLHTGIAGGLHRSISEASLRGCSTWQIFSRNPRGWKTRPLTNDEIRRFREARLVAGLNPCIIHACYLINLATRNTEIRTKSITAFRDEIDRGLAIGADSIVVHPGSGGSASTDDSIAAVGEAIELAVSGLEDRIEKAGFQILIENTAGQGNQIGRSFEQIGDIIASVPRLHMGMCLDTAHSFAVGYDWRSKEGSDAAFELLETSVGLKNVRAVHFNDSKVPLGSQVDRHWHIGRGMIGGEGLAHVINHPGLRHVPFILETPRDDQDSDENNLEAARTLCR